MPLENPPFQVTYSLMCSTLADGTQVVLQTDADGNIPVTIAGGSAVINVDMATVDVTALVTGIGGGKTLADVNTTLGSPAQAGEIAAISDGKTLAELNTTLGSPAQAGEIATAAGGKTLADLDTALATIAAELLNLVGEVEANTAGVGAPNILTAGETGKILTNEGATALNYHTLPTAAAGLTFTFLVRDADGLRITAAAGDTIELEAVVTKAAGYVESTTIGDRVTLVAVNDTEWVDVALRGVWTVETA